MKALGKLNICMQESPPSTTSLRECCSVWQSLIDSAASWKEFSDRVDDIELFLSTLEMAADYLAAKGDEYTSVTVLYLLTKIMELRNNPDPSHFVIITCALASRLLRLGYTGKAGLAFAKTETLIANVKTSTEAKLHWHVGYAEYLAHIGDSAKW
jgi:separase